MHIIVSLLPVYLTKTIPNNSNCSSSLFRREAEIAYSHAYINN